MAGNPMKGEVAFKSNGQDYKLLVDFNTICALEEHFDTSIIELGQKLSTELKARDLRTIFCEALQEHHPGTDEKEAGRIIGGVEGGAARAATILTEALAACFPKGDGTADADPQ